MIEAALLTLELIFVIALLYAINSTDKSDTNKGLGIFDFKRLRTDADVKLSKNGKTGRKGKKNA